MSAFHSVSFASIADQPGSKNSAATRPGVSPPGERSRGELSGSFARVASSLSPFFEGVNFLRIAIDRPASGPARLQCLRRHFCGGNVSLSASPIVVNTKCDQTGIGVIAAFFSAHHGRGNIGEWTDGRHDLRAKFFGGIALREKLNRQWSGMKSSPRSALACP